MTARTILVADEDRDTRIILRAVLERHDFVVVEAENCDDAIDVYQVHSPDLVILNYPMPRSDGLTLVRHLRAHASAHVPIINLTSRVVPQLIQQAALDGVDVTLSKPVDVTVLLNVVRDFMTSRGLASLH